MAGPARTLRALRDEPAYHVPDAAAYVGIPVATLRSWIVAPTTARSRATVPQSALIAPADGKASVLSFNNLVEAHVLRIFRQQHGIRVPQLRAALDYAARELQLERPLLSERLLTDGVGVFVEHLGVLTDISASGAIYLKSLLSAQLRRVAWDNARLAYRLFPQITGVVEGGQPLIAIDPALSFGRPIVVRRGIATHAIVSRIDAGESVQDIADDYELTPDEVNAAAMFENQAA